MLPISQLVLAALGLYAEISTVNQLLVTEAGLVDSLGDCVSQPAIR